MDFFVQKWLGGESPPARQVMSSLRAFPILFCWLLQGVMSQSINWKLLGAQYFSDDVFREEITKLVEVNKVIVWVFMFCKTGLPLMTYDWFSICTEMRFKPSGRKSMGLDEEEGLDSCAE